MKKKWFKYLVIFKVMKIIGVLLFWDSYFL